MAERDYKAEYKKFHSSTASKKKRAELNKYNRDNNTYGNGDGKDASHMNGRIVGFENASENRGRREKSRLKGSKRAVNEQILTRLGEQLRRHIQTSGVKSRFTRESANRLKEALRRIIAKK